MRRFTLTAFVVLLLAGMAALPSTTAAAAPAPVSRFKWLSDPSDMISAQPGTSIGSSVLFSSPPITGGEAPEVRVSGPLEQVLSVDVLGVREIGPQTWGLPMTISVPSAARGRYPGSLQLRAGRSIVSPALPMTVVVDGFDSAIPTRIAAPSPDRVAQLPSGQLVVKDERLVLVSFDAPDPNSVALSAATITGGIVTGSIPDARIFQLRWPGATESQISAYESAIRTLAYIDDVTANAVDNSPTTVTPNDTRWDSWSNTPSGNNWGLEWVDARTAWDTSTGSSAIRVAVIDGDMDGNHGDLDDNVSRKETGPRSGWNGHGSHVAGTICAEGNNSRGITGMMWDCDLRFFGAGNDVATTTQTMVDAVNDGARIINMSLNYIQNGVCGLSAASLRPLAEPANNTMGRAVIHAQRTGRDVLWVFAAGNDCHRDTLHTAPGGLGARFPTNTITVAAIGRNGQLASFSNSGPAVSVAAPGVDIFSTTPRSGCFWFLFCTDNYDFKNGTSMAAPNVSGLAGLVMSNSPTRTAAQTKACIVGGAEKAGTGVTGEVFKTINAPSAVGCTTLANLPPKVDLVFALDLTGSMGGVLSQAQAEVVNTVRDIVAAAPATNFRFSVVSYEDYPGYFDSTSCGSSYQAYYGESSDAPFRITSSFSSDATAIGSAVNGLALGSGWDGPESYGRALWEVAQPDTGAALGFRADALKLLVNFGDNVPHDRNINEGVSGGSLSGDTGIDPGRNGIIDCGGDDIDFQADALGDLSAAGIRLLHVNSGSSSTEPYWRTWASLTGGGYTRLGGRGLTEVLIELLRAV